MRLRGLLAWQSWDWGALALRLVLGTVMVAHGSQKALGWFGGPGPAATIGFVGNLGFQPAWLWGSLLIFSEFVGGLMVLLGVAAEVGALMFAFSMLVAIWKVHARYGFFSQGAGGTGYEYNLVLLAACVALILGGPGRWALWNPFRRPQSAPEPSQ